jgi:chromosome segregation ATPase
MEGKRRENNKESNAKIQENIAKGLENKQFKIDKIVNTKTKQVEIETDKKKKDHEKIELMTQFMLDPTSSATKLLEKRREMYDLQEALQRDKEKFEEKEDQFKKTEEELRSRDEDFHSKIVEYYKNIFATKQAQIQTHNFKLDHEKKIKNDFDYSINNLVNKNEAYKKDLDKLKRILESLKKYEDYLKRVKDEHENFVDINDIINKYKTLRDTYENIKEEEMKARKKKEDERANFRKIKSEYEGRINSILGDIQEIQKDLKV